jgi:hypothetical protein
MDTKETISLTSDQICRWRALLERRNGMANAVKMAMQAAADEERKIGAEEQKMWDEVVGKDRRQCQWTANLDAGVVTRD